MKLARAITVLLVLVGAGATAANKPTVKASTPTIEQFNCCSNPVCPPICK